MRKSVFTWEEAKTVAHGTMPATLKLQLHLWKKTGELVAVRRGVYAFTGAVPSINEIIRAIYPPAYVSTEKALSIYGIIPDVPFKITAITTRPSKEFKTPWGVISFKRINRENFIGYDPKTLLGEKEKVIVDYLYFNKRRFAPELLFWKEKRWQNLRDVDFKKVKKYATLFSSKRLLRLIKGLEEYAATSSAD